ncbi:hypothetical protein Bca52824_027090 [Brassica carinata]|uniref:Uncharacterized protein n=1 Tax=Brassica carinata TaxID=52824 RepID=A0A8X7SJA0_BRACI|nr:hypothetical protein Bca52824_027090 [Brassica carinata]
MSGFLDPSRASLLLGDPVAGSSRGCVLEVPVAARIESRDSIRVSLVVSVSRSRALDCGSA